MNRLAAGAIVWGVWFAGYFLPLELIARFWASCPWPTLSGFFWDFEAEWSPIKFFVIAAAFVLGVHLAFRLTVAALLTIVGALTLALTVHMLTAKHPWAGVTLQQLVAR